MSNTSKISVSYHEVDPLKISLDVEQLEKWLCRLAVAESRSLDTIGFIICSDTYLLDLNQSYLNHDTLTDIITFDYSRESTLAGECYISYDRIVENAEKYAVSPLDELHRVIVHGVLHLCGYNDKSAQEKEAMRAKEDAYLALRK